MAAIIDYASSRFNSVPDIHAAVPNFTKLQASTIISDVLGPLIAAAGMEHIIALTLVHSHFPVPNGGKLVNYGPVATPWSAANLQSCGDNIHPLKWQFVEGGSGITPYEFTYSEQQPPVEAQLTPEVKEFLLILGGVLVEYGLANLIGVRLLGGMYNHLDHAELPDVEVTTGEASITLPGHLFQYGLEPEDTFVETDWEFQKTGEAQGGRPVVCRKCKATCKVRAGEHRNFHQGTNL